MQVLTQKSINILPIIPFKTSASVVLKCKCRGLQKRIVTWLGKTEAQVAVKKMIDRYQCM